MVNTSLIVGKLEFLRGYQCQPSRILKPDVLFKIKVIRT